MKSQNRDFWQTDRIDLYPLSNQNGDTTPSPFRNGKQSYAIAQSN